MQQKTHIHIYIEIFLFLLAINKTEMQSYLVFLFDLGVDYY